MCIISYLFILTMVRRVHPAEIFRACNPGMQRMAILTCSGGVGGLLAETPTSTEMASSEGRHCPRGLPSATAIPARGPVHIHSGLTRRANSSVLVPATDVSGEPSFCCRCRQRLRSAWQRTSRPVRFVGTSHHGRHDWLPSSPLPFRWGLAVSCRRNCRSSCSSPIAPPLAPVDECGSASPPSHLPADGGAPPHARRPVRNAWGPP